MISAAEASPRPLSFLVPFPPDLPALPFPPDLPARFSQTHLEVDRVHTQDVGVQLAQLGQSAREVVDVFNRLAHSSQDLGAMGLQLLGPVVQVEVREVGLRLGVAAEEPGGREKALVLGVLLRRRARTLSLALGSTFREYINLMTFQTEKENKTVFYSV